MATSAGGPSTNAMATGTRSSLSSSTRARARLWLSMQALPRRRGGERRAASAHAKSVPAANRLARNAPKRRGHPGEMPGWPPTSASAGGLLLGQQELDDLVDLVLGQGASEARHDRREPGHDERLRVVDRLADVRSSIHTRLHRLGFRRDVAQVRTGRAAATTSIVTTDTATLASKNLRARNSVR